MKFIHLTDTHLVSPGRTLHGLDPQAGLVDCVSHIRTHHADARFLVLTGDVADAGEPAAYRAVAGALAELPMPVHVIPGNHDARAAFIDAFPQAPRDDNGYVQYAFREQGATFIALDTLEPAQGSGGAFCTDRAEWLAGALRDAGDDAIYLFMHHPPFALGTPALDRVGLVDTKPFIDAIDGAYDLRHIFFGHVHRPVSGHWRGISFSTLYGTNHQTRLDLTPGDYIAYTAEPPAYGVVLLDDDALVVHTCHFRENVTDIKQPR